MNSLIQDIQCAIQNAVSAQLEQDAYRSYVGSASQLLVELLSVQHGGDGVELFCSGTAALETVLRAGKVGPGSEVVLSGYDYPGNFWAVERSGARPVLIDVAEDGWQIDLNQLESLANESDSRVGAVIVSHLHGQLQPMQAIKQLCDRKNWLLIEDNCQAIGSLGRDGNESWLTGSIGSASIVSFGGGKIFSAGRGGALITADSGLLQRARVAAGAGSGPYALSELQAAVIGAQLSYLERLRTVISQYFSELAGALPNGCSCPSQIELDRSLIYQFGVLLPSGATAEQRAQLVGMRVGVGKAEQLAFHGEGFGRDDEGGNQRTRRSECEDE